jgi:hypothetical protein
VLVASGSPALAADLAAATAATAGKMLESVAAVSKSDELQGVVVLSGADAWAVGFQGNKTLIERWNGKAWTVQPSPN